MTVAFGSQAARFDTAGVHPDRKLPGHFIQYTYTREATKNEMSHMAPGTYDIQTHNGAFDAESVSRRQTKSAGWQQQKETENTAKRPHLLYINIAKELKEKEENMSPTKYNVKNTFAESDRPKSTQERRSFVVEV